MDLINIFRTYHPKTEYTFFSSAHGTLSRIDHTLHHKTSLNKFKKIKVTLLIFSDNNAMKPKVNKKKNLERPRSKKNLKGPNFPSKGTRKRGTNKTKQQKKRKLKIELTYNPAIILLDIYPQHTKVLI